MSGNEEFWCFIGIDQSNLHILFGDFSRYNYTFAYFLHPDPKEEKSSIISNLALNMEQEIPKKKLNFILYARVYELYGNALVDTIRLQYPDCRLLCYFGDLVEKHLFLLEDARRAFDYLCTFDLKQAAKYRLHFLEAPMGELDAAPCDIIYDIVFVGEAKDRLDMIFHVYEQLRDHGFRCKFFIRSVPESARKYTDEITYKGMPYQDMLKLDKHARCILEVIQNGGAYSPTSRRAEALLLNKKLLTNCPALRDCKDDQIIYFENADDIDFDKIREPAEPKESNWKERFSVPQMISSIRKFIQEEGTW